VQSRRTWAPRFESEGPKIAAMGRSPPSARQSRAPQASTSFAQAPMKAARKKPQFLAVAPSKLG